MEIHVFRMDLNLHVCKVTTIPTLPIEMIKEIFSYLEDPCDWGNCAIVSKIWRAVVEKFLLPKVQLVKLYITCYDYAPMKTRYNCMEGSPRANYSWMRIGIRGNSLIAKRHTRPPLIPSSQNSPEKHIQTILSFTIPYLWNILKHPIEIVLQTDDPLVAPDTFAVGMKTPLSQVLALLLELQRRKPRPVLGFHVLMQVVPSDSILTALIQSWSKSLQCVSLTSAGTNIKLWVPILVRCPLTHLRIHVGPPSGRSHRYAQVDFSALSPLFDKQQVSLRVINLQFSEFPGKPLFPFSLDHKIITDIAELLVKLPATPHLTLGIPTKYWSSPTPPMRNWMYELFSTLAKRRNNYSVLQTSLVELTVGPKQAPHYLTIGVFMAFPNLLKFNGVLAEANLIDQTIQLIEDLEIARVPKVVTLYCQLQARYDWRFGEIMERATTYARWNWGKEDTRPPQTYFITHMQTKNTMEIHMGSLDQSVDFTIICPFSLESREQLQVRRLINELPYFDCFDS
jgi:hypothetical protein